MNVEAILQRAHELGITLRHGGDRIEYGPKNLATDDFIEDLRQHKAEVLAFLSAPSEESSYDFGGLPTAQVEMAVAWLDKVGVRDPIPRKYNVLSWVRSHLQWNGKNQGAQYEAIRKEQQRLGDLLGREANDR